MGTTRSEMKIHLSEIGHIPSGGIPEGFPLAKVRRITAASLNEPEGRSTLVFGNKDGLNGKGRIGVIDTGRHSVELLPKTYEVDRDMESARRLANVLVEEFVRDPSARAVGSGATDAKEADLSERAMHRFMEEVSLLIEHGLRAIYVRQFGVRRYVKGRIDFAAQAKMHPGQRHLVPVHELAFSVDRPENRVIRMALKIVARRSSISKRRTQARGLAAKMEGVPDSRDIHRDLLLWNQDRLMSNYRDIEPWARIVLRPATGVTVGDLSGETMVWNTHVLFERLVARRLQLRAEVNGLQIVEQGVGASRRYLGVDDEAANAFLLRPDLMICDGGRVLAILDTKWKVSAETEDLDLDLSVPEEVVDDVEVLAGGPPLVRSDVYQMYSYARHFRSARSILIFPATIRFQQPRWFDLGALTLIAVPYDSIRDEFLLGDAGAAIRVFGSEVYALLVFRP